ncbi:hypothetical protein [Streptosporangium sp. NPDC000396]|uniref:hypothetical protein n=1 Tax=Streptosporangium sp. NPDC000396 TaxID=3366185 RepID=UPI00368BEBFC
MRGGPRAGLLATAGVATSEAVHVAVAAAGLAALFEAVHCGAGRWSRLFDLSRRADDPQPQGARK